MNKKIRYILILVIGLLIIIPVTFAQKKAIDKFKKRSTPKKETGIKKEKEEKKDAPPLPGKKEEKALQEKTAAQELSAIAFKVVKTDYKETIPILGTIAPFEKVELVFEEQGIVKEVYVEEGTAVKKEDILAELKEKEFILKEEYSKSKYESEQKLFLSMEKEYGLKKRLYEKGAILKEKLEEIKLKLESQKYKTKSAGKEWELSRENTKKTKLLAPCEGIIDEKNIEPGELVLPNSENKAFTLIKVNKVYAEVGITEKKIPKIRKNLPAIIKVDAYPAKQFAGKIKRIYPSLRGFSRTLTIKIEIDNKRNRLLPGMFLKGDIILFSLQGAYIVPTKSILEVGPGIFSVPLISLDREYSPEELEEGKASGIVNLYNVKVIYRGEEYSAIEGIKDGELAIYQVEGQLSPKVKVKIISIIQYEEDEDEDEKQRITVSQE